jgi:hypothetical protein
VSCADVVEALVDDSAACAAEDSQWLSSWRKPPSWEASRDRLKKARKTQRFSCPNMPEF